MALIECSGCGNTVSDKATACPHCGMPLAPAPGSSQPGNEGSNKNKWIIALAAMLLVMAVAGGFLGYNYYQQKQEAEKAKREKFVSDSIAQAMNDSLMQAALMEKQREDSIRITRELIVSAYTVKLNELDRMVDRKYETDFALKEYFLFDITQDGVPELWVKYGSCEADYELHVFTYADGKTRELYSDAAGHTGYAQGTDYILAVLGHMGYFQLKKISYDGKNVRAKVILDKTFGPDEDYPDVKEPYVPTADFSNTQMLSQFIK